MSLKERVYSVLVVSAAEKFNSTLTTLLPESKYDPVHITSSINAAKRAFADRSYDFVLINAPLPDELGSRFAIDLCRSAETVVLLLVKTDIHADVYDKVAEYGVFTLPKPVTKQALSLAFIWMTSARERLRKAEKKTLSIEEKMKEIRIVNHAKWLLISELKMNEPQAHRYIEKQAMDRCVSRGEVAQEIIKTNS